MRAPAMGIQHVHDSHMPQAGTFPLCADLHITSMMVKEFNQLLSIDQLMVIYLEFKPVHDKYLIQ